MKDPWKDLELPEGCSLERDDLYGYFKIMPRPTDDEIAEHYASAYENPCVPHDPAGQADLIEEFASSPGRVLDIGCGRGELLEVFKRRGWDVVGVEPGENAANLARSKGITVVEDVLTPDLLKQLGQFDVILLDHVLEHLAHPEQMVKMIHNLLVENGCFYCQVPNDFNQLQDVAVRIHDLPTWWITVPDHLNYFSIESLSGFIAGQGFEILAATTDFPVEIFLIWGDIYVNNPEAGSSMHARRCRFEENMKKAGKGKLLRDIYYELAKLGVGREAIVVARRLE